MSVSPAAAQTTFKWSQDPDLTPLGVDVSASTPVILASDYLCDRRGPVTRITVWGSWRGDYLPYGHDPNAVLFRLSIHADIPAEQSPTGYSMPGEPLWMRAFQPGEFLSEVVNVEMPEGWFDPLQQIFLYPSDFTCWKYTFTIPAAEAFVQQGTPLSPVVYWLDFQAYPQDLEAAFGWKTSSRRWNDDSVWGSGSEPYPGPWRELIYPPEHEYAGQSMDLAFAIEGEAAWDMDFGDAPDGPYPTLLASDGARHGVVPGIQIGLALDGETDGLPDWSALGDDNNNLDDEEGISLLSPIIPHESSGITFTIPVDGYVDGWIDFDGNGSWADGGDYFYSSFLPAGAHSVYFSVPEWAVPGQTFARFRYNTAGAVSYVGAAPDGEVEDYAYTVEGIDYGDAPDNPFLPGYPTWWMNNGARHVIVPGVCLGVLIDHEGEGQPGPGADGDDLHGSDDEDGVVLPSVLYPGEPGVIQVTASAAGYLEAWIDWAANSNWSDPGDQVAGQSIPAGTTLLTVWVPAGAQLGQTYARFRFNTLGPVGFAGLASDGEVEDYQVTVASRPESKWLQPPDLSPLGLDVCASHGHILADDFLCTQTGFLNHIRIWGSWLNDLVGQAPFVLSIHADIPAEESPTGYSMPGETLWWRVFWPGSYQTEPYATGLQEGWFCPAGFYLPSGDTQCWVVDFSMEPSEAFFQRGTPDHPVVYWLDVKALTYEGPMFGWKTSETHWNDDAVWGEGDEPYQGRWDELRYPLGHPLYPQSIDLAFALQCMPVAPEMDFGDAPDQVVNFGYPTLLASNGARHTVVPGISLGPQADAEWDGQPDPLAMGDDNAGLDDEDGVTFLTWVRAGKIAQIQVDASVPGILRAWIDFDRNGSWAEADNQIYDGPVGPGPTILSVPVPQFANPGYTYARFRFSTLPIPGFDGWAPDGEVEDYGVQIIEPSGLPDHPPERFGLFQNLPNPFSTATTIAFDLPEVEHVVLEVFTTDGRHVATLVDGLRQAGRHQVAWSGLDDQGRKVQPGIYFYRLTAGSFNAMKRLVLIR